MTIILENQDAANAFADPYLADLANRGYAMTNYHGVTHPSQPNYIALVSGSRHGVFLDMNWNVDDSSIADPIEAAGLTWKSYQESWPGNCFSGQSSGTYHRKHNPFISFNNIRNDPARCANIVDASKLAADAAAGQLPNYIFYTPDINHDGHNTGLAAASQWLQGFLEPLLADPAFADTLFHITFDEAANYFAPNKIYTVLLGQGILGAGKTDDVEYNHYSFLATLEQIFGLPSLGQNDASATLIPLQCN
ncbi:phosphoesterase [Chytriomyces sp. MP71]|nr:phosphoesterase [Chytriomyces sp. MP71]